MPSATLTDESLISRTARNFFTHSGHVPVVMLILEFLLARRGYFAGTDPYLLICAGLTQAWLSEWLAVRGKPHPFLANLVGPFFYTVVEAVLEGGEFFLQWHHQAYWIFSFGFGVLHAAQAARKTIAPTLVLAENILRSAIPLVMYALFEARSTKEAFSLDVFFSDSAHVFLAIVLLLLGMLLGFADIGLRTSLAKVRELTARLRQYSEWSLGRGILDRAIADERVLSLHRVERTVLFVDIRGFTAWSELQSPEIVVGMLNDYYATAEDALGGMNPIRVKYTADEIMAVFADATSAVGAGRRILSATAPLLSSCGLSVGAGVHGGPVMEGVLGGGGSRAYDFIGDTVNTAKRLCDAAQSEEMLVSEATCANAGIRAERTREVAAKGKREPIVVAVISIHASSATDTAVDTAADAATSSGAPHAAR